MLFWDDCEVSYRFWHSVLHRQNTSFSLFARSFCTKPVLFFPFLFTFISTCRLVLGCGCRFFSRQSLEPGLSCTCQVDSQIAHSILQNSKPKAIVISTIGTILTVIDFMSWSTLNALRIPKVCANCQQSVHPTQVSSVFVASSVCPEED